jgi:energy-coupling factor transporter ATP-binding protein EcfA2/uncharacterized membrane protein
MPSRREQQIETTLNALLERARAAQNLLPRPEDRAGVEEAARRARAGLTGAQPGAFLIALAGGTGAGKSTLINALAGASIADAGERRPTTSRLTVYHHHELPRGGLPPWLAANARFITHDREALRQKVLIDTPDLDSFVREHRELTRELLKAAGLVLYVLSGEKYLNADILAVLREERRFSGCAVVLNKIDLLGGPAEVEQIATDIRERLADFDVAEAPFFKVCARWHEPGAAPRSTDDFGNLTHYIEQELESSEIERLRRRRQAEILAYLGEAVDGVAPPDLAARLERFGAQCEGLAGEAAEQLLQQLGGRLPAVDLDLAPLAVMGWHQRFWGPLRAWLAASDFTRFGLAALARRFISNNPGRDQNASGLLLGGGADALIGGLFEDLARQQQDLLYQAGLPVEPWRRRLAGESPALRSSELDGAIRSQYLASAGASGMGTLRRWLSGLVVHGVSAAGAVIAIGLAGWGLWGAILQTMRGQFYGLNVLGHVASLIVLVFALLQVVADLLFVPRRRGGAIASRMIAEAVRRWNEGWVRAYRGEIEDEWRGLRDSLGAVHALLNGDVPVVAGDPKDNRDGRI